MPNANAGCPGVGRDHHFTIELALERLLQNRSVELPVAVVDPDGERSAGGRGLLGWCWHRRRSGVPGSCLRKGRTRRERRQPGQGGQKTRAHTNGIDHGCTTKRQV